MMIIIQGLRKCEIITATKCFPTSAYMYMTCNPFCQVGSFSTKYLLRVIEVKPLAWAEIELAARQKGK